MKENCSNLLRWAMRLGRRRDDPSWGELKTKIHFSKEALANRKPKNFSQISIYVYVGHTTPTMCSHIYIQIQIYIYKYKCIYIYAYTYFLNISTHPYPKPPEGWTAVESPQLLAEQARPWMGRINRPSGKPNNTSVNLSTYLSIYVCIYVCIYQSINQSIYLPTHMYDRHVLYIYINKTLRVSSWFCLG